MFKQICFKHVQKSLLVSNMSTVSLEFQDTVINLNSVSLSGKSVCFLDLGDCFHFFFAGIWFFHCHLESHLEQGQAMLFKVGNPEDWENPPANFPRCGSYGTEDAPEFCPRSSCKQDTDGNNTLNHKSISAF